MDSITKFKITITETDRLELKKKVEAVAKDHFGAQGERAEKKTEASSWLSALDPGYCILQAVRLACHGNTSDKTFSESMEIEVDRLCLRPSKEEQEDEAFKGLMSLDDQWLAWDKDDDKEEIQRKVDWNDDLTRDMQLWRYHHDP
jgi:hypothetical protein